MCSITSLLSYFASEPNSVDQGENYYKSSHVEAFGYSVRSLKGKVHASMKDRLCNVTVSDQLV